MNTNNETDIKTNSKQNYKELIMSNELKECIDIINGNYLIRNYCCKRDEIIIHYTINTNGNKCIYVDNCGNLYYTKINDKYVTYTNFTKPLSNSIINYISCLYYEDVSPIAVIDILVRKNNITNKYKIIENIDNINLYFSDSYIIGLINVKVLSYGGATIPNYKIIIDNYGYIYVQYNNSHETNMLNKEYKYEHKLSDKYIDLINIIVRKLIINLKSKNIDNSIVNEEIKNAINDIVKLNNEDYILSNKLGSVIKNVMIENDKIKTELELLKQLRSVVIENDKLKSELKYQLDNYSL